MQTLLSTGLQSSHWQTTFRYAATGRSVGSKVSMAVAPQHPRNFFLLIRRLSGPAKAGRTGDEPHLPTPAISCLAPTHPLSKVPPAAPRAPAPASSGRPPPLVRGALRRGQWPLPAARSRRRGSCGGGGGGQRVLVGVGDGGDVLGRFAEVALRHKGRKAQRAQRLVRRSRRRRERHEHQRLAASAQARLQKVRQLGVAEGDVRRPRANGGEDVGQRRQRLVDGLRLLEPIPRRVRPVPPTRSAAAPRPWPAPAVALCLLSRAAPQSPQPLAIFKPQPSVTAKAPYNRPPRPRPPPHSEAAARMAFLGRRTGRAVRCPRGPPG